MLVALYEPEIPPNTGNIARLCAAFNVELHLVEPLGFRLENRYLKRAGLDYWPNVRMFTWPDFTAFANRAGRPDDERLIMATAKGIDTMPLQYFNFAKNDALIFGPETRGLPAHILDMSPFHARIPILNMENGGVRSLNLSTACGIVLYAGLLGAGLLAGAN